MKKLPSILLFFVVIVLVAAGAAVLSLAFYQGCRQPAPQNAHDWVHTKLALTEEQQEALVPIEHRYHEEREHLERKMQDANIALAEAILADGRDSERVHQAIEQIHLQMGDLQKVTIGHVFEMREVLSPEQYDQLLKLTAEALRNLKAHSEDGAAH